MKKTLLLFLSVACGSPLCAQEQMDTLSLKLYDPLSGVSGYSAEFSGDEDDSGYFLPAQSGNNNYLPIGQLSRNLIGVRFRSRGYDNRFQQYEVNGADLSDPTDGFPYWNILAGINLLSPVHNDVLNITPSSSLPGGIGGVTSLSTTDRFNSGSGRVSYAYTNRSYRHRVTVQDRRRWSNGLTTAIGVSGQAGNDGFVTGAFSDRVNAAFGLHGPLGNNNRHILSWLAAATFSQQGVRSAATQEVYDLAGDNYYNPNWGYQNGKVRNSRERSYNQYFTALSYSGQVDEAWKARVAVSFFGGENSYTLLSWYDAPTPYPDYYRYLPDFYPNSLVSEPLRSQWHAGNPSVTQIDWNKLYEANLYHTDPNGIRRSHYVMRDLVTEKRNVALSGFLAYEPDNRLSVRGGLRLRSDYSDNYARLNDLLGGSYWLDIDQYLLDDEYYGGMYQNDVRNPDRPVFEDQRFGYNYRIRSTSMKLWSAMDYRTANWSFFAGAETGRISFEREGKYEKELYPGYLSYGKSKKIDFSENTLKAGFFYHFNLRHRIGLQAMTGTHSPVVKNLFVSPSYRNETVADPGGVNITGAELVYQWLSPHVSINASGYITHFSGESETRNFYDDMESEYMNLSMTGIEKIHGGAEGGLEWNATPRLSLLGVLAVGVYKYNNDPSVTLYRDSDGQVMLSGATAYLSGYRLAGTPQTAGMIQINYRTRSYWRFELFGKYTAHNYVSINPVRRMTRALDLAGSPEVQRQMAAQERLDDAFLLSLSVSRTFRLPNGNRIGFWANIDNLMNDRTIRYSGYEQWRFTRTADGAGRTLKPFPSKYYYAYGTNFYAMLSYSF